MAGKGDGPFVLGIDLGSNSVGWSLVRLDHGKPAGLLRAGARVFDPGTEGDILSGRDESRNAKRRQARQARRMLWRRARRQASIFHLLQSSGLLPEGPADTPEGRDRILKNLDTYLRGQILREGAVGHSVPAPHHVLPYLLRARALDKRLELHELGRALYQLGQRRGFLSNRKSNRKEKDEDLGAVKKGISDLAEAIRTSGARTLGEYFSRLDPEVARIRRRWTARTMYMEEFDAIWAAQSTHHPTVLTEDFRKRLRKVLFYQRPLRLQSGLVGACELEKGKRRAPWACLEAQSFRLLQKVNDVEYTTEDGEVLRPNQGQRMALVEALENQGDLTFAKAKKAMGLARTSHLNLEEGGETKIPGNRTRSALRKLLGDRWHALTPVQVEALLEDLRSIEREGVLERRGREVWGLSPEAARDLAQTSLEEGYCGLSRKALRKLLPLLERGTPLATARLQVYGDQLASTKPEESLPRAPQVRNPVVNRSLTELRKVVNAILREHGKPARIRIELGRDLRQSRRQREERWRRNRDREKMRKEAAERVVREAGIPTPSAADVERVLLADECGWVCPYSGRAISMNALLGEHPQFDVEHIIPFARSLDDSFANRTLCHHEENRNRKSDRAPFEAYSADAARWDEILQRVKRFSGELRREKLRRFQMEPDDIAAEFEGFASRQLNDTRYASVLAADFLGRLYGGRSDASGMRIQVGNGQITAYLRSEWGLNSLLNDGPRKTRDDHRHHAVDAIAIALTDAGTVKALSEAAGHATQEGRRRFGRVDHPWPAFLEEVRKVVSGVVVSHRVNRKLSGALHEETIYSPPKPFVDEAGKPREAAHVRKELQKLTRDEVDAIVDPVIRGAVLKKLEDGGGDLKTFSAPENHPYTKASGGRRIPIHKVRVRKIERVVPLGAGVRTRHLRLASNHHMEVFEVKGPGGAVRWKAEIVPMLEALRRVAAGRPVVGRYNSDGTSFLFSLGSGESIRLSKGPRQGLFKVTGFAAKATGDVLADLRPNTEARPAVELRKLQGGRIRLGPEQLRKAGAEKMTLDPLGRPLPAHD